MGYIHDLIGRMISRPPNGWSFSILLMLWRISTYQGNLRHVSRLLCKSSLGKEQQKSFPLCKIFSWRGSNHRNLSKKASHGSFLRDSSSISLLSFLSGIDLIRDESEDSEVGDWQLTLCFQSSVSLTFRVVVLLFSFVSIFLSPETFVTLFYCHILVIILVVDKKCRMTYIPAGIATRQRDVGDQNATTPHYDRTLPITRCFTGFFSNIHA